MKQMVCETCESMNLKKESNLFVCQNCGAQYVIEDSRKLLKEIEANGLQQNTIDKSCENKNKVFKLKYDLYCWLLFFKKCHDLESTFEISSDNYNEKDYIDIVVREPQWKNNIKNYYNQILYPKIRDKFIKENHDIYESYKQYCRPIHNYNTEIEKHDYLETKRVEKNKRIGLSFFVACGVLLCGGWVFTLFLETPYYLILFSCMTCLVLGTIFYNVKPNYRRGEKKKIIDLDLFLNREVTSYLTYVNKYRDLFLNECNKREAYIKNNIPDLKKIKQHLKENIPLPEKYCNELDIKCLYMLVIDERATSLEDAINLYEDEKIKNEVMNKLKDLDDKLLELKNEIQNLNNMVNADEAFVLEMNKLINQNNLISAQLYQLNYSSDQNLTATILNN